MSDQSPRLSARISAIEESATLAISARAKALKAEGVDVIGFGAGEPSFPTPPAIVESAVLACRDEKNHKYSAAGGLPELKAAVVAKTARDSGFEVEANQVLITNGAKQAVYNTFAALCDPGDEVIVPGPFWNTYPEAIQLAGGTPVIVSTDEETAFKVTVEQLEAVRTKRTKILLLCSPSNPTGAVYSRGQLIAIGEWAVEHGVWVVADEIYEHLVYGAHTQHSLPVLVPDLANTCVVINGVSKTYAMTGWRVGWMIAPADVTKAAANLQSHSTSNVSNIAQRAALAAVEGPLTAVAEMREAFDRRRIAMHTALNAMPGVTAMEPEGAFYALPNFAGALGKIYAGRRAETTLDLAAILLDEAKVAIVPGEAFGAPGYGRLSFVLGDDDLATGMRRIHDLLASA